MTTDTVGGVWTYSLELAQALLAHDVEIVLATMGPLPTPEQIAEAESVRSITLHTSAYRLEWMDDPWRDVERAGEWLLDLERQVRPDIVHLNGYAHGALNWSAPCVIAGHSCVFSWWHAVKREPPPDLWDRYRQEVRRGLRAAQPVMAPTEAMLSSLIQHYGPLPQARVIPNCRRGSIFHGGPKEPLVLAAGRAWDEAKNIAALERAAPKLAWPVYVAGEEEHPNGGAMDLHHVHKLGKLSTRQMIDWYARASIYALPARYEPFGLSALEAALSGCALVLGDIPSLREVWGDAAVFVAPDGDTQLEAAINELASDHVRLGEMSDRAWLRAKRYSPERMARQYMDALRQAGLVSTSTAAQIGGI